MRLLFYSDCGPAGATCGASDGRPGVGSGAVAAESLAVKHQLLIMKRSQRRSPNLTAWDSSVFLDSVRRRCRPDAWAKSPCILKDLDPPAPSSSFGQTQISSALRLQELRAPRPQRPVQRVDRRGGRDETAQPILRLPQDRQTISNAFGIEINKDAVRRILIRYYRPGPGGGGPSWLSVIGQARNRLWSVDLFRTESILLKSYWVMVVMDVYTRRIVGFGVGVTRANLDGIRVCRMFNRAIARQAMPGFYPRTTIRCFAFIAGERTFGYSKSMRSRPFPQRPVPSFRRAANRNHPARVSGIESGFGTRATSNRSSRTTRCSTTNIAVTPD